MAQHETTITSKGQIYLSKEIREALGLRPRDRVRIRTVDGNLVVERCGTGAADGILRWAGAFQFPDRFASLEDIKEDYERAVAEDAMREISG